MPDDVRDVGSSAAGCSSGGWPLGPPAPSGRDGGRALGPAVPNGRFGARSARRGSSEAERSEGIQLPFESVL